ncbi:MULTISPECIES: hypothetical protein [Streptomyces]|uniref:hypothetical protein n=1 Tax=Streptomyces TaxID=1883 RepID=UPI0018DFDA37|nr:MULTISPECIES: hypothetical protein [Streptomyces]MCZ4122498.1 hypothetical protein [Streptomyces sp. H39-S7]
MGNRRVWFGSIGVYLLTVVVGTVADHAVLDQGWGEAARMAAVLAFMPVVAVLAARWRNRMR